MKQQAQMGAIAPEKAQRSQCADSVLNYYKQYEYKGKKKQAKLHESIFQIDDHYRLVEKIGQGAYGVVAAAIDNGHPEKKSIAVKKIEKAFEDRLYTKRTLRELKLLRLMHHENIINIETIMMPRSRQDFDDIYCVSELMETDLRQIIKSNQELSPEHSKFFIYQALRGLKYIHSAGVIHRDLKPRNLLVNSNCDLKICDFGLARAVNESQRKSDNLTDYVITRWYRPPELLLSSTDYTTAVDVWSIGIIFAELLTRKPLLQGQSTSDQLLKTFDLIGTPTEEEIAAIPIPEYRTFVRNIGKKAPKNFQKMFPTASNEAIDLLQRLLTFDARKRITVEDALKHPFLSDFHIPEEEPIREKVPAIEFEFEDYPKLTRQQFKDLVYEEILLYHFPDFKKSYMDKIAKGQSICAHIVHNDNQYQIDPHEFSDDEGGADEGH